MNTIYNTAGKLVILAIVFFVGACAPKEQKADAGDDDEQTDVTTTEEELNADLPEIIGTSWSLLCIYENGAEPKYLHNFPEYLFCKNGRWELHSLTTSAGQMGTYTIEGNQLTTIHDGSDKLTGNYTITWNEAEQYLELNDGKMIFRLRYRTKAQC